MLRRRAAAPRDDLFRTMRFHIDNLLLPVKEIVLIMLKGKIKSIHSQRNWKHSRAASGGGGGGKAESPIFMHIK